MRKSELIRSIASLNPDLSEPVCRTLVEKLFNAIIDHLRDGGAVELRGFGRFFSKPACSANRPKPSDGGGYPERRIRGSTISSRQVNMCPD
uniref:HU family DNA-binding protein n=1 Tax=Sphingomonas sp. CFBP 8765 TaxID=2775274 RepID=UPI00237BDD16|nr:HU family DNA-binding protein [Sphingomonas sp. CFBP 8765]